MKIVVGLGNPGRKYEATRHNVGFRVLRAFHTIHAPDFGGWREEADALVSEGSRDGARTVLLLPTTFMNASGDAVGRLVRYLRIDPADVLVVLDDLDLPLGKIRARSAGSSGGHKGLDSVIENLGTEGIPRLRLGIAGTGAASLEAEKYVLQRFDDEEQKTIEEAIGQAVRAIDVWLTQGIEATMNQSN
ncbi:hypothetical protein AMJ57_02150 [Parcubacteria bacterium SG8_24]|nr:MAG: hypothetical protein AMJ57_02150 [Parcubacteria bacterium SG8_24]